VWKATLLRNLISTVSEHLLFDCNISILDNGLTSLKLQILSRNFSIVNNLKKHKLKNHNVSEETSSVLRWTPEHTRGQKFLPKRSGFLTVRFLTVFFCLVYNENYTPQKILSDLICLDFKLRHHPVHLATRTSVLKAKTTSSSGAIRNIFVLYFAIINWTERARATLLIWTLTIHNGITERSEYEASKGHIN
jgi:hypothetical protein